MLPEWCGPCDTGHLCCDTLWEQANFILEAAHAKVVDCATPDCCGEISAIVSVGEPHQAQGDYVAVWVAGIDPVPVIEPRMQMFPAAVVRYSVKLLESGWPTVRQVATEIHIPSPESITAASRHSYAHAEAMYRGVLNAMTVPPQCGLLRAFQPLEPVPAAGGLIGWTCGVTLELPWSPWSRS